MMMLQLSDVADEAEDKIRGLVRVNAASELVNTTPRPPSLCTQRGHRIDALNNRPCSLIKWKLTTFFDTSVAQPTSMYIYFCARRSYDKRYTGLYSRFVRFCQRLKIVKLKKLPVSEWVNEWMNEWMNEGNWMSHSTHNIFKRPVLIPDNRLHWCWQPSLGPHQRYKRKKIPHKQYTEYGKCVN